MRPRDREVLDELIKAGEDYAIVLSRALFPRPGETPPFDDTRRIARSRFLDAVEELISHSELSK